MVDDFVRDNAANPGASVEKSASQLLAFPFLEMFDLSDSNLS